MNRKHQRGIGMLKLLILFGAIGFTTIVVFASLPAWLNYMKVNRAVAAVAATSPRTITQARQDLQRYWDIEDIVDIEPRDVKLAKSAAGTHLTFDYYSERHLFANVSLIFYFAREYRIAAGVLP